FSADFIVRDDSQMSVVPLMSALMPVPEPPPVTWRTVPGFFFIYSSAHRWPRMTIVSEPFTVIVPACAGVAGSDSRPPATNAAVNRDLSFILDSPLVVFADLDAGSDLKLRLELQRELIVRHPLGRIDARL